MNAFKKFVLIPHSEYISLKRFSELGVILNSNSPSELKKNALTHFYGDHTHSKDATTQFTDKTRPLMDKSNSNPSLQHDIFSTPISSIHELDHQDRDGSIPRDSEHELSSVLEKFADSKGRLLDSFDRPIRGSNVTKIKEYIRDEHGSRGPPGIARAVKKISQQSLSSKVKNKKVKEQIKREKEKNQKGGERRLWSSLREF